MIQLHPILVLGSLLSIAASVEAQCERQIFDAEDGVDVDQFSSSLSASGSTCFVGSDHDDAPLMDSGSVYVFDRIDGSWERSQWIACNRSGNATPQAY